MSKHAITELYVAELVYNKLITVSLFVWEFDVFIRNYNKLMVNMTWLYKTNIIYVT